MTGNLKGMQGCLSQTRAVEDEQLWQPPSYYSDVIKLQTKHPHAVLIMKPLTK